MFGPGENKAGIVTYGVYVPRFRILPEEIARIWGENGEAMKKGLMIYSKSVPYPDEDVITISVEAARNALARSGIDPEEIGAVYVGSESHPYAVKPSGTIVAEAIGASHFITVADYEFACKAGTAAIQTSMGLVSSGMVKYSLAIGSDTSQGAPGDALEYSASAGGAAFVIGRENMIAKINRTFSFTSDTPDFWRREGQAYPSHGGRFTGEPAYFRHVSTCARELMKLQGTSAADYDYAVFHQPNGKFPTRVAQMLGFEKRQIETGLMTPYIGNTYSASMMIGLAAILDIAKPGDRIFGVAFGSGAGSDGFDITVTDEMGTFNRDAAPTVRQLVERSEILDYGTYAKFKGKIAMKE
ncbi:MAG: hydroxymethylglutaryl-CoA synthase [Thermoplasmata archaeon]|uniref:Hydroxymethylglutaryl-CoA synthase n=1 Tax=Candidatus Sysuiplasma superficiale TaxID=2823368 RepID=A0A8J7YUP6_9ARCH|nr:hydroxymethylglutaryl-CoA synthase [Candidatus Sysuiplasma superficiale]